MEVVPVCIGLAVLVSVRGQVHQDLLPPSHLMRIELQDALGLKLRPSVAFFSLSTKGMSGSALHIMV